MNTRFYIGARRVLTIQLEVINSKTMPRMQTVSNPNANDSPECHPNKVDRAPKIWPKATQSKVIKQTMRRRLQNPETVQ